MSQTWQSFLDTLAYDDSATAMTASGIYPLQRFVFIVIEGIDAAKFLQGQLSCDIQTISGENSGLGSHSSAKGRMQSSFRICLLSPNCYALRVHHSIAEQAKKVLAKYIVFSKASISIANDLVGIGFIGEYAKNQLQQWFDKLPETDFAQSQTDGKTLICTSHEFQSYELYCSQYSAIQIMHSLSEKLPIHSDKQHQLLENQLGLAFVEQATADNFTPQAFNLQFTPAVSFKKGCYTGQEIVARLHYLGKMKRHMRHFTFHCNGAINTGDKLYNKENSQSIGDVLSAVCTAENQWDALINLGNECDYQQLYTEQKTALSNINEVRLPYSLE